MDDSKVPPRKQPPEVPRLTGPEVRSRTFKKALFGYGVEEVDAFLEHVARVIDKAARHERDVAERLQALQEEVAHFRAREAELTEMRQRAEVEAAETRRKAQEEAAETKREAEDHAQRALREAEKGAQLVRAKAEEWLASLFERVEETERRRTSFFTAFRSALDSHYELLRKDEAATVPLKAELTQFLRKSFEAPVETRGPRLNS